MVSKKIIIQPHLHIIFVISLAFQLSYSNEISHLLSFKGSIQDPTHFLSNWNNSTPLCNWNGITCSPSKTHVQEINLSSKNISGDIPPSLFRLSRVESIDLSSNQLQGNIPFGVFSCLSLQYLSLSNNNLSGPVPSPVLGSGLQTLDLSNNMISGTIPENLDNLILMRYLDLGGNVLTGRIPRSISNMTNLEYLTLASNQLIGEIPHELGNLKKLKLIYLGYNKFVGQIPYEIGSLSSLYHLDLVYNNLSGPIPKSLGNLTNLQYLFLYQNKLNGTIPSSIMSLQNLISLDLSDNSLQGQIPKNLTLLQNLQALHLFSNNLTGIIPSLISSLPKLQVLQLWSNNLHGQIPQDLGKNNNLTILDLSTNGLSGRIPISLCNSKNLHKLILFSNSLEGEIPPSLGNCNSLERIRMQNNSISGALPKGFTKLNNVYFLDVSSNNLSGHVDHDSWDMTSLQMLNMGKNKFVGGLPELSSSVKLENLDLSENSFSGSIPKSYGKLWELMELRLDMNQISGVIPEELSLCKKMVTLDLSHNRLTGLIPFGLGQMHVLGQLDLSNNQLSGEIPRNLGLIDSLVEVNVSYNHLQGSLPSTSAFLAINSSDVAGNDDLCDEDHLSSVLPPCREGMKGPTTTAVWWGLGASLLGVAMIIIAGFGIFVLLYVKRRKNNSLLQVQRVENEDGIWEVQYFDGKASKLISDKIQDILSRKSYKIIKNNDGEEMDFVVEEMGVNNLWEEILEIGKIKHCNIVKLLGAIKGEKSRVLIYEKLEGKCISEALHGLSWGSRRKIVIGIARALKFLHYNCSPSLLVGEMSPERVIVGGNDGEARVKLGVGGLFCLGPKSFLSSPYIAPETKEAKEITDKNDIYGFGLILIELLTGKGPMDAELGTHSGIVRWARHCYSKCHIDTWIDPMIREQRLNDNHNEIVETMNLALQCTSNDPIARPNSSDVVKSLECSFLRTRICVLGIESFKFLGFT